MAKGRDGGNDRGIGKVMLALREALILQAAGVRLRKGHELVKAGDPEEVTLALGIGGEPGSPLEARSRELLRSLQEDPLVEMAGLEILGPGVIRVKVARYRWEKRESALERVLKFRPLRGIAGHGNKEP